MLLMPGISDINFSAPGTKQEMFVDNDESSRSSESKAYDNSISSFRRRIWYILYHYFLKQVSQLHYVHPFPGYTDAITLSLL